MRCNYQFFHWCAVREPISLSFYHLLGWDFSISCSKGFGISAQRNVICDAWWCFSLSWFSEWHPQAWVRWLNCTVYGVSQALQMGFTEAYNLGGATYDTYFEMWSTSLAFWSGYVAFFWGGDTNSKGEQDFLPSVGPQIESALTEYWKQGDLPCLCYFLWHWMGTLQLFLAKSLHLNVYLGRFFLFQG